MILVCPEQALWSHVDVGSTLHPPAASLSSCWPTSKDGDGNAYLVERSGRQREIMYVELVAGATEKARKGVRPHEVRVPQPIGKNEEEIEEPHRYTNAGIWSQGGEHPPRGWLTGGAQDGLSST